MERSENSSEDHQKHKSVILDYLQNKEQIFSSGNRCPQCYHSYQYCICKSLPAVHLHENIQLIVYMDCKEVFNAGDDGKLLLSVLPKQSKRFIYGLEDEELVHHLESVPRSDIVVLFPSSMALSFPEWMEQRPRSIPSDSNLLAGVPPLRPPLTVIVVDAVWRHARRMACRLREILPDIRHVQLTPEQMSVYARKQSQPDRICTVEATALFLFQLGESEHDTDNLVECVKINNLALKQPALKPSKQKKTKKPCLTAALAADEGETETDVSGRSLLRHPAWYFGRPFREPTKEFNPSEMIRSGGDVEVSRGKENAAAS